MNTSNLKSFSQQARQRLMDGVNRRLQYWGFDKNGKPTDKPEPVQGGYLFRAKVFDDTTVPGRYEKLKNALASSSYAEVQEKATYTWFNRLMALKILAQNGYETAQIDYLNPQSLTPAILERARRGQYTFLTTAEQLRLQPLLTDYAKEAEAFGILLTGFCRQHPLIYAIFGGIDDYTELLLPDNILAEDGMLNLLNNGKYIDDEDYKKVELIGWLYQFYISERKDEVFKSFKAGKKAEAKDIPAATQIFTPNWIVKYLVQNTLGRTWLDAHPHSELKKDWKYLVEADAAPQEPPEASPLRGGLEGLTFLDPASGSGHILVEAFDVLYAMYMAEYYTQEEAVESILQHNLYGLDLDERAVQLARFAVVLKAAPYHREVLKGKLLPHICAMPTHRVFNPDEVDLFLAPEHLHHRKQILAALKTMEQAYNLGSIMVLELSKAARQAVAERLIYWQQAIPRNFDETLVQQVMPQYILVLLALTQEYTCIAANPPYMGQKNMNKNLKLYINENYPLTKTDLYSVFMDVCILRLYDDGRYGMINMHNWMFLSSYQKLRDELLKENTIESLLHLGPRTFDELSGEVVQNSAFVIKKAKIDNPVSTFKRLVENIGSENKRIAFIERNCLSFKIPQEKFKDIPSSPIAYWATNSIIEIFKKLPSLSSVAEPRQGMATADNDRFLRYWHEVSKTRIGYGINSNDEAKISNFKWFPYNKGGTFRKWYGNNDLVINWENDGYEVKSLIPKSVIRNPNYYFKAGMTWSSLTGGSFSGRFCNNGFLFDSKGPMLFNKKNKSIKYITALLNSKVGNLFLGILAPTLDFNQGPVGRVPYCEDDILIIEELAQTCKEIAEKDWNSKEYSWSFENIPFLQNKNNNLEESYIYWKKKSFDSILYLKRIEEEINNKFYKIYHLKDYLDLTVSLKDITILQDEVDFDSAEDSNNYDEFPEIRFKKDIVIQQTIHYLIGCYMGRYRLDIPGLHVAHPNPAEDELQPYRFTHSAGEQVFEIDDDAIIPLMGSMGSFADDMVLRIRDVIQKIWGPGTLTQNINFLQECLGKDLEDYLVKDFWKFHCRYYSKKPIYWLFSSPKGAFQVLVYMHRMHPFTVGRIRSKYLLPHLRHLQDRIAELEKNAATLPRAELKKLDTLRKQLAECEAYDLQLKDVADRQISFDLDDGVTRNYAKFEGVVMPIK